MALEVKLLSRSVFGSQRVSVADVTFDESYQSGGLPVTLGDLGLYRVTFVQVSPSAGYAFEYDYSDGKILVYGTGSEDEEPFTELSADTDLSSVTVRVMAYGH